jgi:BASS family bile acid:Na+ symporter
LLGIALPPIDRLLRPYVTPAIFILLCIAFVRVDTAALAGYARRPTLVILATAWTTIGIPILFGTGCLLIGLDNAAPDLFQGLMLQAVASPMMAAPALAALMGLDATLVLAILVTSTSRRCSS